MAIKIARQPANIALLGAPTSAASLAPGHERGPQALRAAGLVERLTAAGFSVRDYGDCTVRISKPDEEHPRARNVEQARAAVDELCPKIEIAVKTGALPLVLGGDDTIALATIAGCRRYYRHVSLIDMDRDGGLNVPATTLSGCVDGMVLSHMIGRGAPELVRFWGEPPLVREPDGGPLWRRAAGRAGDEVPDRFAAAPLFGGRCAAQRSRRCRGRGARTHPRQDQRIRAAHRPGRDFRRRFSGNELYPPPAVYASRRFEKRCRCLRASRRWPRSRCARTIRRSIRRARRRAA